MRRAGVGQSPWKGDGFPSPGFSWDKGLCVPEGSGSAVSYVLWRSSQALKLESIKEPIH